MFNKKLGRYDKESNASWFNQILEKIEASNRGSIFDGPIVRKFVIFKACFLNEIKKTEAMFLYLSWFMSSQCRFSIAVVAIILFNAA